MQSLTTPLQHQRTVFEEAKDKPYHGLFLEMGTGKTKIAVDLANYNHAQHDCHVVLVFCLKSVMGTWEREIDKHCYHEYSLQLWKPRRKHKRDPNKDRLQFYVFNFEALITPKGKEFIREIINRRPFQIIVDEGYYFKNPTAERTKSLFRLRKRSSFRYMLDGTPIAQNIFDMYAKIKFLDMQYKMSYTEYKNRYGDWRKIKTDKNRWGYYKKLVNYKNVDDAISKVRQYGSVVQKSECMDLPAKIREEQFVDLSAQQKRLLTELNDAGRIVLEDGTIAEPENVLSKNTLVHRILGGSITDRHLLSDIPKLDALENLLPFATGQVIIWARLHAELDLIASRVGCPVYDGRNTTAENNELEQCFQAGEIPVLAATQRSAGVGLTLTQGTFVVYYTNDHSFYFRIQSEDRSHRYGLKSAVTYTDLFANHSLEKRMYKRLQERFKLHHVVMNNNDLLDEDL